MIVEHAPQPADLDARIAVGAGVIVRRAAKPVDRHRIGLELIAAAGGGFAHQEGEQPFHDRRAREIGRRDHGIELLPHQFGIAQRGIRRPAGRRPFVPIGGHLASVVHARKAIA
ncbi:hypothetical protein ACFSTI_20485 [Rhizorhabdus histidinilytica]